MAKRICRRLLLASALLIAGWQAAEAQLAGQPCREDYRLLCAGVQQGGGRAIQCLKDHAMQLSPACRDALVAARTPAATPAPPPAAAAPTAALGPPPVPAAPRPGPTPASPEAAKAAAGDACRSDIRQYCAANPQGLIGQCLKEHAVQLSPGCREALVALRTASPAAPIAAPAPPPAAVMTAAPPAAPPPPVSPEAAKSAAGKACRGDIRDYCKGVPQGGGLIGQCLKEHVAQLSPGCRDALVAVRAATPAAAPGVPSPNR